MNVSLPKLSLFLALLLLPCWQWAQSVRLETYQDTPVSYSFVSQPNKPSSAYKPLHGTVEWKETSTKNHYNLTYTPEPNFIGQDSFRLIIWETFWKLYTFKVNVSPALIRANHDYAYTTAGKKVTIDVTANDFSSTGVKQVAIVPIANFGAATLNGNQIDFVPQAGYAGLAHFNYTVCNGQGDCDEGTVSVTVLGESAQDTIRVFTKKNQAQYILSPDSYLLVNGPKHGIYDPAQDVPTYTPNADYVGPDVLVFDMNGDRKVYAIEVLDLTDNVFAFDDKVYTVINEPVEINVLKNDLYGTLAGCFTFDQPQYGTVAQAGTSSALKGRLVYTPPTGFSGVDKFTYTTYPPECSGKPETAIVYVFVSNFEPAASYFRMVTPRKTPMIIGYNVPTSTFNFSVSDQGELGKAMFLEGTVDTVIYGIKVKGENLLVYIPDADVNSGVDELEITYCLLNPEGGCITSKTVKIEMEIIDVGNSSPVCFGDCVWAGDTNFDGIVSMADLLPIGLYMGEIGIPRQGATLDNWYGQYAEDWSRLFSPNSGPNLKHIDADGDSVVTALDTLAISRFYGRTHTMVPKQLSYNTFDIFLEGDVFAEPGDLVVLKIRLGTAAKPAKDVYGFVFPFEYDPQMFRPESVQLRFSDHNWLGYDSPVLHMQHNNRGGKLEAGFTRTGGRAVSGHGPVGELKLVVVEDVVGFLEGETDTESDYVPVELGGEMATVMDGNGQMSSVYIHPFQLRVRTRPTLPPTDATPEEVLSEKLLVFPNPANDYLTVHLNGRRTFEKLTLTDIHGRVVLHQESLDTNHANLNLSRLPNGIYTLTVVTPEGLLNKKVEIVR